MLISVKILKGGECNIEVTGQETINSIKQIVEQELQIPAHKQRLVFRGKTMMDEDLLCDHQVASGNRVHCFVKQDSDLPKIPNEIDEQVQPVCPSIKVDNPITNQRIQVKIPLRVKTGRWKKLYLRPKENAKRCSESEQKLYVQLMEVLLKHFTPDDAKKVVVEFQKILKHRLDYCTLDDLEHIVASYRMNSQVMPLGGLFHRNPET